MVKLDNLDNIVISGIGIISALGTDLAEIRNKLKNGVSESFNGEIEFSSPVPSVKMRRLNRYSKLALCSSLSAQIDASVEINPEDCSRYGTIFTSGYGAMVSNVDFGRSVAGGEPDLCSPILFAGTVPNSCVGQVCMQLKLKGPSTSLVGGNVLFYSKHLIQSGKADVIFAGAVEEYSTDLFASLRNNEYAKNVDIREATVVFVIQKEKEAEKAYCSVGNSASGGLSAYPLIKQVNCDKSRAIIECTVKACVSGISVDAVYTSANGSYFDEIEQSVIEKIFPGAEIISNIKICFGETMGSSFSLNAAAAALSFKDTNRKNILVTGVDPIGNYHCTVLESHGD
ncbi:MAG: hypothetical protein LBC86_11475 [Oscillospiraceae bacterium]|jgi:3-oxoacyl-(acyl-carrier-protein) synthase|nr:hypothetical protein [Oscillospiraceae bacterium]